MLGGHWLALQSVAWTRMLIQFSHLDPVAVAIEKTFDGDHPCGMCLSIRDGREEEERDPQQAPLTKREKAPELFMEPDRQFLFAAPDAIVGLLPDFHEFPSDFLDTPPTPPPRALRAA